MSKLSGGLSRAVSTPRRFVLAQIRVVITATAAVGATLSRTVPPS